MTETYSPVEFWNLANLARMTLAYEFDLDYAQTLISEYKDLLWLAMTLLSTTVVIYGILLPQRNAMRHRKYEATVALIERWTSQQFPLALITYQNQVANDPIPLVHSESKTRLYSFFHTVSLLIREQKVDEPLLRKSQIGLGFMCFYDSLLKEQPDLLHKHSYYGQEFQILYRRWRSLKRASSEKSHPFTPLQMTLQGSSDSISSEEAKILQETLLK